jgi:hypothetical protein
MEATIPIPETTDPQPDLGPFDAYEAKRIAPPEAETEKPAAGTEEEKPETSEKLETTEGSEQQAGKPKKDRTADARFAEFTFAHKQRMAQIEKERDEWRQKAEAQGQTQQPQADKKPESAAGEPDLDKFVSELKADEKYELAIMRYNKAVRQYEKEQEKAESVQRETEARTQEKQAKTQEKLAKAHEKYEDFGDLMTRPIPGSIGPAILEFIEEFDDLGAVRELLSNPEELQRVSQLSKAKQLIELGKIDDRLSKPEPKPTAPHVSKAPAPLRNLGGSSSEGNDDLNEAKTFEEFERLRAKQRKK